MSEETEIRKDIEGISEERYKKESRRFRGIRNFWAQYRKSKFGLVGLSIFFIFLFAALFAPYVAPYHPNTQAVFPKVYPAFAEPKFMEIFDPETPQPVVYGREPGQFETDDSITSLEQINGTLGWNIYVEVRSVTILIRPSPYRQRVVEGPWTALNSTQLAQTPFNISGQVIDDPYKDNNKVMHLQYFDNYTIDTLDPVAVELEAGERVQLNQNFYRVRMRTSAPWEFDEVPKEISGYMNFMVLGPEDDGKDYNDLDPYLPIDQDFVTQFDYNRSLQTDNASITQIGDSQLTPTLLMNNENYWNREDIKALNCPEAHVDTDILKCQRVEKVIRNRPYFHGKWAALPDERYGGTPNIFLNPTDRYQIFAQKGTIDLDLSFEFGNGATEGVGVFDLFIDDFYVETGYKYWGLMGGTEEGADVFSVLIYGTQASLIVGIVATAVSMIIGIVVGLAAGYAGGIVDDLIMRGVDFLLIMPTLPLLMALAAVLRPSMWNIIIVIAILGWTGTARLIRSQVLIEKEKAYVESAKAAGASDTYILFKHILPNVLPLVFALLATGVSGSILSLASLDYLQLGDKFTVSWGHMLYSASTSGAATSGYWWMVVPPGLAIGLLSLSFALMGYTTQQIVNPRLRSRG